MGTYRRKYLIVEVYDFDRIKKSEKRIDNYIKKIKLPYRDLFGKFNGVVGGLLVYFMCWDNSKEGWDDMEEAEKIRNSFIKFVKSVSEGYILHIRESSDNPAELYVENYEKTKKTEVSGGEKE